MIIAALVLFLSIIMIATGCHIYDKNEPKEKERD